MADYNARFATPPASKKYLHWPLGAADDLEDAFAWKEERNFAQALSLQYDRVIFILEPSEQARPAPGGEQRAAIGKRVTVFDYSDGRPAVKLANTTFDKLRQASIVDNKRLGSVLLHVLQWQIKRAAARTQSAPPKPGPPYVQTRLNPIRSPFWRARRFRSPC